MIFWVLFSTHIFMFLINNNVKDTIQKLRYIQLQFDMKHVQIEQSTPKISGKIHH